MKLEYFMSKLCLNNLSLNCEKNHPMNYLVQIKILIHLEYQISFGYGLSPFDLNFF